jgi:ABC-type phosphate transport system substrate-binding protein
MSKPFTPVLALARVPALAAHANARLALLALGAWLAPLALAGPAAAGGPDDVVVVVHAGNTKSALTIAEIRGIYLGNDKFWGDTRITSLARKPDHAAAKLFFKEAIGQTATRFKVYWHKRALAGKGIEPREIADARALLDAVRGDPGAVGFVLRCELEADGGKGVKVVATIEAK